MLYHHSDIHNYDIIYYDYSIIKGKNQLLYRLHKGNIPMTEQYISDEEFDALSEKEQVAVLINMIKDAPRNELILLKIRWTKYPGFKNSFRGILHLKRAVASSALF